MSIIGSVNLAVDGAVTDSAGNPIVLPAGTTPIGVSVIGKTTGTAPKAEIGHATTTDAFLPATAIDAISSRLATGSEIGDALAADTPVLAAVTGTVTGGTAQVVIEYSVAE